MKIVCIGGGPAGLYFSLLLKKANPTHDITVVERNAEGSTFGWGVVFSAQTLGEFTKADPETASQINAGLAHWDDIEVYMRGEVVRSSGHGFCGIARIKLLQILADRARSLGVKIEFNSDVEDETRYKDADVIVACDGVFSRVRERRAGVFKPDLQKRLCRYTWLGTRRLFDAFTFLFEETEHGWFQAHCYRFDKETSTFIVEAPEEVWRKAGIDKMSKDESVAFCEKLFAKYLNGEKLISNSNHLIGSAAWINFVRVTCERWYDGKVVLLGDAAATAHFSIGSGTKLAMESAISLARWLEKEPNLERAFAGYEEERRVEVLKLQSAARNSTDWFENVALKAKLEPQQFAYSLLTRSQRVSHENLRVRDKRYLEDFERWFAERATGKRYAERIPSMFVPIKLREMELVNRIAVSPMSMYSAVEGVPNDFHLVHYGGLALGGAGLIFTEMTDISADGRITPGCAGIYTDEQAAAWERIVRFIHEHSAAKAALQLGHAGPKGSTKTAWEGMDQPLPSGNWPLLAPSPIPYTRESQIPREMTKGDMARVVSDYVAAAKRAVRCGFDLLELHCAHGYLLSSFLSPLTNKRTDEYGGSLRNRVRFPAEIFKALRAVWPADRPMSVRISAVDWVPGGNEVDDAVAIAQIFKECGADIIDVSTGEVSKAQKPVYGRMFQTPYADRIRSEVGIATMAVGNIFEPDHVNSIVAAGRADICLLARPHLADPHWTLRAGAELGFSAQPWPKQYLSAKRQMEVNIKRANEGTI
ncbi:MAG: hypothetical protein RL417_1175 [Pseudomonadota bacterium]